MRTSHYQVVSLNSNKALKKALYMRIHEIRDYMYLRYDDVDCQVLKEVLLRKQYTHAPTTIIDEFEG